MQCGGGESATSILEAFAICLDTNSSPGYRYALDAQRRGRNWFVTNRHGMFRLRASMFAPMSPSLITRSNPIESYRRLSSRRYAAICETSGRFPAAGSSTLSSERATSGPRPPSIGVGICTSCTLPGPPGCASSRRP